MEKRETKRNIFFQHSLAKASFCVLVHKQSVDYWKFQLSLDIL